MKETTQIDNTDISILNQLLQNSRLSYRQLAKKTQLSVVTVMNRVKAMEKAGIIRKYSAFIDYGKLNYDLQVLIDVRVSKGKLVQVEKKIAEDPNVTAVYDIAGSFDVAVIAKFKNRRALDLFVKKLQVIDYVERTETKLILNAVKEEPLEL